uniref:Unkown protein n=1 Tax=Riptortus pedestris TaxID=329032 RepID=R4WDQ9_RIPPE|nr:unkown protein [Riptortus pedestris]
MGTMEVISLDDTADTSLFIIDEAPIMEETTKGRKRKATGKKKNWKKSKTSQNENEPKRGHVVMGGVVPDDQTVKPRKANSLETIVIDDDESVIELSDDEVGVIGGELSASFERAQQQLNPFQVRPSNVINHRKQDKGAIERKKRVPEVKEQLPTAISSPKKSGSNVDSKAAFCKKETSTHSN